MRPIAALGHPSGSAIPPWRSCLLDEREGREGSAAIGVKDEPEDDDADSVPLHEQQEGAIDDEGIRSERREAIRAELDEESSDDYGAERIEEGASEDESPETMRLERMAANLTEQASRRRAKRSMSLL